MWATILVILLVLCLISSSAGGGFYYYMKTVEDKLAALKEGGWASGLKMVQVTAGTNTVIPPHEYPDFEAVTGIVQTGVPGIVLFDIADMSFLVHRWGRIYLEQHMPLDNPRGPPQGSQQNSESTMKFIDLSKGVTRKLLGTVTKIEPTKMTIAFVGGSSKEYVYEPSVNSVNPESESDQFVKDMIQTFFGELLKTIKSNPPK